MADCIFCMIRDGEIPSRKVYEDEHVFAILDNSQVTPGHTLLIPKKHVRNIFDYDEELAREVFAAVPKVARALRDFDPEVRGLNILLNNEEVASQTVFHSHIHLLPRYSENDDFGLEWAYNEDKYSDTQLDQLQKSIMNELGDD
ncbi:histidine triad (HIT) family protein [Atopostipes suicloacalis DSM 15692]|uniref:Histidine triad (HIT) family protein n=1 Tax=Atopostipes suicloacalis DSM 15692 TaxID=1121025 RepID=A0A1M4XBQ8_9LACT|nr:HIT family protein [Atopostipes suicloacalis]SHE90883.1 histidine triad (HIT) family protein [Atopostipes suicloacalis DSM 15692]